MTAAKEGEHRFEMGELPDQIMETCKRLAKLTEPLRGLAESFLKDLTEKTGSHDILRLHRFTLPMNRATGMFEPQGKLCRLASRAPSLRQRVSHWSSL